MSNKNLKTGAAGRKLIIDCEGFRSKPYLCTSDRPTIGYGSTFYEDGTRVKLTDSPITKERAEELFANTLIGYEDIVKRNVKVKLNQNQFDALVSHTYNTGGSETMFRLVNENATSKVIWDWFTKHYILSGGKVSNGLIKRRKLEAILFQS